MTTNHDEWRKSSYSGGQNNDCVEVNLARKGLRDSKNPDGPTLEGLNLGTFFDAVKAGRVR